ncbi:sigma-70 family RNA polymerase sigma factor [Streptomyces nondiastaticus]|uniref:sigma-70 family RNA polymerase sigma factor n=1 Tax=Streptomyces nondiastaticus TaxID=3154512 RepID=UPI00341F33FF
MNLDSTAGVVEAARGGDRAAQGELVAACLPLVYNIVGRALNGHADVDDVVQETMIRMVGGLGGLRDPEGFRSWLVAITMNQIRSHWRKERGDRKDAPAGGPQEMAEAAAPEPDFVEWSILRLGLQGQRRQAAEATRWLDGEDQVVMSLWWLEAAGELNRAEVAAALGRSPQYTAVRVQRTKAQLETARVVVRALATTPRCPELTGVLGGWDGAPGPLWRKRIARHARGCSDCGGHWSALVPAEGLLAGLGLVPLGAALLGRLTGSAMGDAMTACAATGPAEASGNAASSGAAAPSSSAPSGTAGRAARRAVVAGVIAVVVAGALGGGPQLFSAAPESAAPQAPGGPVEIVPVTAGGPTATAPERTAATPVGRSENNGRIPVRESAVPAQPAPAATPSVTPATDTAPARTGAQAGPSRKPGAEASPRRTPPPAPGTDLAQEVVRIVNKERAKAGCGPVRHSAELVAYAQGRTDDTARHTPLNQWSAFARGMSAPGHHWSTYGVNAATGHGSASAVVTAWMNDPGQRRTVLNCAYTEIGVGVTFTYDGPRWLQVFAAR